MFDPQPVPTPATTYFQAVGQQIADHVEALAHLGPAFARLADRLRPSHAVGR